MTVTELDIKEINKQASQHFLGMKATSRSIKTVQLAHVMMNHVLGYSYDNQDLYRFTRKPSKVDFEDLEDDLVGKFQSERGVTEREINEIRWLFHDVLHEDNSFYPGSKMNSAPTFTSDWQINDLSISVTPGRYLYTLISSEEELKTKLEKQLKNHMDGISVMFRPFTMEAEKEEITPSTLSDPELGPLMNEGYISDNLQEGYRTLGKHLEDSRDKKSLKQLRLIVKFSSFAFYSYIINRNNEIRDDGRDSFVPILLNYAESDVIEEASVNTRGKAFSEVVNGTRKGIRHELDRIGAKGLSEEDIREIVESDKLVTGRNGEKHSNAKEVFIENFNSEETGSTFENLVNTVDNVNHVSLFKTYTPRNTVQTFGKNCGLLKPRGNAAKNRYYKPDVEIIEALVKSVVGPEETVPVNEFLNRLIDDYGILVGGTDREKDILSDWNISMGTTDKRSTPLKRNFEAFKQVLVDLGYATEYADDVTMVSGDIS
ncbi:MAG: hypothetical protein ABEJ83_02760 [Candidatus Nanohaloarchaea archaeon]